MNRYAYKARDKAGNVVTGEVEASSPQVAAKLIRKRGLIVVSLKQDRGLTSIFSSFKNRVSGSDVSNFTRQLATMIEAGLPIIDALSIMGNQTSGYMKKIVAQILADVEGGESLSSSLSRHPKVFSPTYIALIRSGEVGGVMDEVLARLADNLEKNQEFQGRVKGALIYPAIIIVGMFVVALVMFIFVIPRLTTLYEEFDAELPLATRILIGISSFVVRFWPVVLILVFGGIYAFRAYRKTDKGRRKTDALIFKIPIIGDLQRQVVLTELTRTMSLMVGSGVSILESLNITAQVSSNSIVSDALKNISDQVEKGFAVAYAFAKHPEAFPFILSQMIAVGEETGKMDEVLTKVSRVFEVESDQKVKALTSAVEPLVMVMLGVGVGFLVIAIILPIYNLTSQF